MTNTKEVEHKRGWEREFWKLLSPATAELLKAELAKKSETNTDKPLNKE